MHHRPVDLFAEVLCTTVELWWASMDIQGINDVQANVPSTRLPMRPCVCLDEEFMSSA